MNVLEIPLIDYLGIIRNTEGYLSLPLSAKIESFFHTHHAGSQYTLAEAASIDHMQTTFPELSDKTVPVLRGSETKFKQLSKQTITAFVSIEDQSADKFVQQLAKKSRGSIRIDIKLVDSEDVTTFMGSFDWFIQLSSEM